MKHSGGWRPDGAVTRDGTQDPVEEPGKERSHLARTNHTRLGETQERDREGIQKEG